MEQKRQKVENSFLKHLWLLRHKEEEKVVLLTSLHVHVLVKNKERKMHKIISKSAVWFFHFNSLSLCYCKKAVSQIKQKEVTQAFISQQVCLVQALQAG